jgi:hypothetical protein
VGQALEDYVSRDICKLSCIVVNLHLFVRFFIGVEVKMRKVVAFLVWLFLYTNFILLQSNISADGCQLSLPHLSGACRGSVKDTEWVMDAKGRSFN